MIGGKIILSAIIVLTIKAWFSIVQFFSIVLFIHILHDKICVLESLVMYLHAFGEKHFFMFNANKVFVLYTSISNILIKLGTKRH